MSKITKSTFQTELQGQTLSKEALQKEAGFEGVNLDKVDANKDGQISGSKETEQLYKVIDSFDRNGDANSFDLIDRNGKATQPSRMLDSVRKTAVKDSLTSEQKDTFQKELQGKAISTSVLRGQMGLDSGSIQTIDKNRDGRIYGASEVDLLFKKIDSFDNNGDGGSVTSAVNGTTTRAGELVAIAKANAVDYDPSLEWRQNIVRSAQDLVANHAEGYGVDSSWYNVDPNHAIGKTGDTGGVKGSWKCNLFLGNVLYHAGMETPFYGDGTKGNYPNANQVYKWSDQYNTSYGTKERFELRGELDVQSITDYGQREAAIRKLLETAEPGDMILVDHVGDDVRDGGHCRVVVENNLRTGGGIHNAQASRDSAVVKNEGIERFMGEETIWILRANQPKKNFQAGTLLGD